MMRLFVAVWPPATVLQALAGLERPELPGVRWTAPEQWHVTLRFMGAVDEAAVEEVAAALAGAAAGCRRVDAVVGPATGCFGKSILMVPIAGLGDVAAATVAATATWGEPPHPRPFVGHMTLARSRRGGRDLRRFSGQSVAGEWPVDEVTLVRSRTDRTGARYEVLRRLALSG